MLISEEALDNSLARSLTGRILLGDIDLQEQSPYHTIPVSCLESPEHRELACESARQSIVLSKNENNAAVQAAKKGSTWYVHGKQKLPKSQ